MSVFDPKSNPAICVLPWVHEYTDTRGRVAPCCHGLTLEKNETMSFVRQEMLNGIKPRVCTNCYTNEEESGWSHRIQENIDWIKKFGEPDINNPTVQYIDVRFDPTCNLKCKTCGPWASTLWQKEKNVSLPVNSTNKERFNKIDKKNLRKVYLAGGEPTYIRQYLEFLEDLYVVNPSCEVIISTNLKKLPDAWKRIIKIFENLTVICSCDSINTLGRYVRYPLIWDEFEENVRFVSENANFLQFNLVASNLTSHKIYETCLWMKQFSSNINISILTDPESMAEHAVPFEHRQTYIENIKKLSKFPVSVYYAMNFRNKIQYLIKKYSEAEYNKELHKKLVEEITEQDSHRTLKLCDVDPFLYQWIYG
jgi:organic radical activating enzyme